MIFPTILIVDDEPAIRKSLTGLLTDEGYEVVSADNGYEALKLIDEDPPDLVLLDIWLPGMDGIETLKEIKQNHPYLPVVMITGHGSIETAVIATKFGAFDFLEKPLSIDKIILTINNSLNFRNIEEENIYLKSKILEKNSINGISKVVTNLKKEIFKIANSDAWVLLQGESGTGKKLVAKSIHQLSKRADKIMSPINCVSIKNDLMAKELLGSEKGILGEHKSKGVFEIANGGTLFFNEIGDMNLETQKLLTHFLEAQKFKRLGGEREISVDVRIIASTNKNLKKMIKKGTFRKDLFFRLNVVPVFMPPLRERKEDIPILVDNFLTEVAEKQQNKKKKIDKAVLKKLCKNEWKGNIRELKNFINRLTILVKSDTITVSDLPEYDFTTKIKQNRALSKNSKNHKI